MEQRKDGEEEEGEVALQRRRPRYQNSTTTLTNNYGDANMDLKLANKSESSSEKEGENRVENPKPADPLGCLSFFKIFIPTDEKTTKGAALPTIPESEIEEIDEGSGFNPFRIFGHGGRTDKNTQISQQEPAETENLPASYIAYEKGNKVIGQGNVHGQQVKESDNAAPDPSCILIEVLSDQSILPLSLKVTLSLSKTMCINGVLSGPTTGILRGQELVGTPTFQEPVLTGEKTMTRAALPTKPESEIGERVCVEAKKPEGADATMLEAEQVKAGEFKSTMHIFFMLMAVTVSIVYGGLVESIASLGVVSSAAAADATTLNIVALGLANLIGLFIIGHNLMEVKNDGPKGTSNERNVKADRNQENFLLLATVAVLTFLVFGLILHVTYGFSFWKSDKRDLKLVAVAAASLLCTAILAFGNTCIRTPPKFYKHFKTLLCYVSNAILVSGVFYMVGDLIKKLMEKFG